jgi:hypothetical protein
MDEDLLAMLIDGMYLKDKPLVCTYSHNVIIPSAELVSTDLTVTSASGSPASMHVRYLR